MRKAKNKIIRALSEYLEGYFSEEELERAIRVQPNDRWGDLSLEMFGLEDKLGYPRAELAKDLKEGIPDFGEEFSDIKPLSGFLNFHLNRRGLVQRTLHEILTKRENFGANQLGSGQKVVFDYSAPNVGKPLHVGHIRSTIIGDSLIRIMQFSGYQTHGINYLGDVGLHIGKVTHAFKERGSIERLEEDPERELLDLYVSFCQREKEDSALTDLARKEVQLIEAEDPETLRILETIRKYSLRSFDQIYRTLGVSIDETIGQSYFSDKGKEIVKKAVEMGIAEVTKEGAVVMKLSQYDLPDKVILRSDGTAIYSTQDLGAAITRFEEHQFDRMLYIVGEAQALYFRQLFKSLELLGYEWAERCQHVGFGLIHLAEGKMATREGAIVYLKELLDKAIGAARKILDEKRPDMEDKEEIAQTIGIGAIKYQILSVDNIKDIQFSWDRALDFTGKSAPNIQYTYVRANSILRKAGYDENQSDHNFNPDELLGNDEYQLIRKMSLFPLIVESALITLRPHIVANYAYELASEFNHLYNSERMLEDPQKLKSRLTMLNAYQIVISNAMGLLGIEMPDEM